MSLEVVWLVWWILCLLFCCILHVLGRGVFASKQIEFGQFICEYFGELISAEEGEVRERTKASSFRYFFNYKGSAYWWAFHICLSSEVSLWLQAVLTHLRINPCVFYCSFSARFSCSPSSAIYLNLTAYLGMNQCSNWSSCDPDLDRNSVWFVLGTFSQICTQCVALDHYWGR